MARREYNIPVHIHKNGNDPKPAANNIEYIEKEEQMDTTEYLNELSMRKQKKQEQPEMTEDFAENIMQGMIDHQNETPRPPLEPKDKRNLILWFGVSVFIIAIFVVWFLGLRTNFQSITNELDKNEDTVTFNSFSESFSESLEVIKNNISAFENIKEELEAEKTKQDTVDVLKEKVEEETENEEKQLPTSPATNN